MSTERPPLENEAQLAALLFGPSKNTITLVQTHEHDDEQQAAARRFLGLTQPTEHDNNDNDDD